MKRISGKFSQINFNVLIIQGRCGDGAPGGVAPHHELVRQRQLRGTGSAPVHCEPGRGKEELHYKPGSGLQGSQQANQSVLHYVEPPPPQRSGVPRQTEL
jgi:hypothetical protein